MEFVIRTVGKVRSTKVFLRKLKWEELRQKPFWVLALRIRIQLMNAAVVGHNRGQESTETILVAELANRAGKLSTSAERARKEISKACTMLRRSGFEAALLDDPHGHIAISRDEKRIKTLGFVSQVGARIGNLQQKKVKKLRKQMFLLYDRLPASEKRPPKKRAGK